MIIPLALYWDRLNRYDWFDQNHDIPPREALGDRRALLEMSRLSPRHRELYRQFMDHHFGGPPWGGLKPPPKPKRPRYE